MRRLKVNTIFLFAVTILFSITSIGYSALSQAVTVGGDVTYSTGLLYSVFERTNNSNYVHEYTGSHQDSMAGVGSNKIYHWYADNDTDGTAILDKNNVIFANHCWQMIRTTDTGGVKMIYNGEVVNGQCLSTRGDHVGFYWPLTTTDNLTSNYWYGTNYTYDSSTSSFQIAGTTEQTTWNATTGPNLIGKYTCMQTTENATCTTLYFILKYYNATKAWIIPLRPNSKYSQFGTLGFNMGNSSPADAGYMYNTRYTYKEKELTNMKNYNESTIVNTYLYTSSWYADSVTWGSPTANKYNLDNPYQISSASDYPNLVGKYTFGRSSQSYTSTSVYYILGVDDNIMHAIKLSDGKNLAYYYNYTYTYGNEFIYNGNGTYTINNPTTMNLIDWLSNYSSMNNKYVCKNTTNNTCSELWYVISTSNSSMTYSKVANNYMADTYKYANGFTYNSNTGIYTLNSDSVTFWNMNDSSNKESISTHHYTCWNTTGECTTLSYIYFITSTSDVLTYVDLTEGKSINDALEEMLSNDNVNNFDSTIKKGIEGWYKKHLIEYDSYLEDTIFCNNRSIDNLNGFNPNGGDTHDYLKFREYNITTDLSCANITDRFSVSNNKAHLTYKVGLMSVPEMNLLNNGKIRKSAADYWLISPKYFYNAPWLAVTGSGGILNNAVTNSDKGIRPTISLKPGTKYTSGNGSMASPYVIDASPAYYVYSLNYNGVGIGNSISSLGTIYYSLESALFNFNREVMLRHEYSGNEITSSSIVISKNNNVYYLKYGTEYFDENKNIIATIFGSSNCSTTGSGSTTVYKCNSSSSTSNALVRKNGFIYYEDGDHRFCRVDESGVSLCTWNTEA